MRVLFEGIQQHEEECSNSSLVITFPLLCFEAFEWVSFIIVALLRASCLELAFVLVLALAWFLAIIVVVVVIVVDEKIFVV